jgi:hypothetical protein
MPRELTIRLLRVFFGGGFSIMEMAKLIPRPDDLSADLLHAEWEFERDVQRINKILDEGPSLGELSEVLSTQYKWAVFFSNRHPNPKVREFFRLEAEEQLAWDREQMPAVEKLIQRSMKGRQ